MCDTCNTDPREGRNAVARLYAHLTDTEVRELLAVALVGLTIALPHLPIRRKVRMLLGNPRMFLLLADVDQVLDNLQPLTTNPKENPHG